MDKGSTAVEYWEKAIELDSMNSNAFITLGNYYYKQNKLERAITYWLASMISMPEEPTSNLNLAIAYSQKEYYMEAFRFYERYLKFAQDKTNEKYLEIKNKIEKNKKLANDYIKLGIQYQSNNDNKSALMCYKRSASYCPIFSKSHLNIGSLYYMDQNYEQAIRYWTNAYYLDPNYPKIINNLAISYDILKQFDYAFCYYTRYLKYIQSKPIELEKINTRCNKIKPILNENPYLVTKHLEKAQDAFSKCDYYKALDEFKNYIILNPLEQEKYIEQIIKIENFLSPDKHVIENCILQGRKTMEQDRDFAKAKKYFARILVLAPQTSQEYQEAKVKLSICLQQS